MSFILLVVTILAMIAAAMIGGQGNVEFWRMALIIIGIAMIGIGAISVTKNR